MTTTMTQAENVHSSNNKWLRSESLFSIIETKSCTQSKPIPAIVGAVAVSAVEGDAESAAAV